MSRLPFYSVCKACIFLYLSLPQSEVSRRGSLPSALLRSSPADFRIQGSSYIYRNHLAPFFTDHETDIDAFLASLRTRAGTAVATAIAWLWERVKAQINVCACLPSASPTANSCPHPGSFFVGASDVMDWCRSLCLFKINDMLTRPHRWESRFNIPLACISRQHYRIQHLGQYNSFTATPLITLPGTFHPLALLSPLFTDCEMVTLICATVICRWPSPHFPLPPHRHLSTHAQLRTVLSRVRVTKIAIERNK